MTVWPLEPVWSKPAYQGFGRPRQPRLRSGQRLTMAERSLALPEESWREITVAEGSQGPRTYRFGAQRVRETRDRKLGEVAWAIYRQNLDGSEPRYYLSNAPLDTSLETLAHVGGSRWRIETEFETDKSDIGLDEYETRTWAGWHHHVAMCLLGGAFLLGLQQDWGKKMPLITRPQSLPSCRRGCTGWCGRCCRGNGSDRVSCCNGWKMSNGATSGRNAPTRNAVPPAAGKHQASLFKPVVVILEIWPESGVGRPAAIFGVNMRSGS